MKLGYYHYYLKERRKRNAPRINFNLRNFLSAYIKHPDNIWKQGLCIEDGENIFLIPTKKKHVHMLVATKQQEIVKAVSSSTLTCSDIRERLNSDESAGFAAYLTVEKDFLALAATLKGPRTSALNKFVHILLNSVQGTKWKFEMQALGSSISLEQAKGLAYVASSKINVGPENSLFKQVKELFSVDCDNVGSFEIVMRGKKNRNLQSIFTEMANDTDRKDLKSMKVRGRQYAEEALTDYFVEADGRFSEDIGTGTESQILKKIKSFVTANDQIEGMITNLKEGAIYEDGNISELNRLCNTDHWRRCLRRT